jgi:septation ring formation regulator EzrA
MPDFLAYLIALIVVVIVAFSFAYFVKGGNNDH